MRDLVDAFDRDPERRIRDAVAADDDAMPETAEQQLAEEWERDGVSLDDYSDVLDVGEDSLHDD